MLFKYKEKTFKIDRILNLKNYNHYFVLKYYRIFDGRERNSWGLKHGADSRRLLLSFVTFRLIFPF